jgi:hypothetical protein
MGTDLIPPVCRSSHCSDRWIESVTSPLSRPLPGMLPAFAQCPGRPLTWLKSRP